MSGGDAYTLHLLWRAVQACHATNRWLTSYPPHPNGSWYVEAATGIQGDSTRSCEGLGSTLADALAALLADLRVEVPQRPSAERMRGVREEMDDLGEILNDHLDYLRDLAAREPLVVDALLGRLDPEVRP